jgi:hypothetical protein
LEASEARYFRSYVTNLMDKHEKSGQDLSYFELNLETWRQLWRVIEMSDILLVIVDIRSVAPFPEVFYKLPARQGKRKFSFNLETPFYQSFVTRDRCYDLKNIFAEFFGKSWRF